MSSSQASRALLESSTETFNTNSTISISSDSNRSANYHEFINKNDHDHIQQEYDQEGKFTNSFIVIFKNEEIIFFLLIKIFHMLTI